MIVLMLCAHLSTSCAGLTRASMRRSDDESLTLRRFIMDGRVKPGHDER